MSRVQGHLSTQAETPCGRTVFLGSLVGNSDAQTGVVDFSIPSRSSKTVYIVQLDLNTAEIVCLCMDQQTRYDTWEGIVLHGTYMENLSLQKAGVRLAPLVTRSPSSMCFHCRLVRRWLKSHKIYSACVAAEEYWQTKLERMEPQLKAVS